MAHPTRQPTTTTTEERRAEVRAVLAEVRRARSHPAVLATRAALLDSIEGQRNEGQK